MGSSYREKGFRYSRTAARRKGALLGTGVVVCLLVYFYFRQGQPSEHRHSSFIKGDAGLAQRMRQESARDRKQLASLYEGRKGTDFEKDKQFVMRMQLANKLSKDGTEKEMVVLDRKTNVTQVNKTRDPELGYKLNNETVSRVSTNSTKLHRNHATISDKSKSYKHFNQSQTIGSNITLQYEKDCMIFRTKVLNKTDTTICKQSLGIDDLFMEILKDKVSWKMDHFKAMQAASLASGGLVIVDIDCGSGALPMIALNISNTIIAVDKYTDNLRILQRALFAFRKEKSVTLLPFRVSNTSVPKNKTSDNIPVTTLDVIGQSHIQKNKSVVVLMSQNGYELEALQGGKTFFKLHNVCAVIVDQSFRRTKEKGSEIVKHMQTFGFHQFKNSTILSSSDQVNSGIVFASNSTKCASFFL